MAYLIHHIDELSRRKKRNVVYVKFMRPEATSVEKHIKNIEPKRKMVIDWLSKRKIDWEPCFDFFSGAIAEPYDGHIYIELTANKKDRKFVELCKLLEHEDEAPKFKGVNLFTVRYSDAKKNGKFYNDVMESEE